MKLSPILLRFTAYLKPLYWPVLPLALVMVFNEPFHLRLQPQAVMQ